MNKFREADYKYIVDDLHHAFQQLCYRFGVDFDEVDGEFGITSKAHHLDGIVKKEIAEETGININTVYHHIRKERK